MSAIAILRDASAITGWNDASMLALVCEYIDRQGDDPCFKDFIHQQEDLEANFPAGACGECGGRKAHYETCYHIDCDEDDQDIHGCKLAT